VTILGKEAMTSVALKARPQIVVGVDTHKDFHVASAKDQLGRSIGNIKAATTELGYRKLLAWAQRLGVIESFGIEGPNSYGAGLARYLSEHGESVLEIGRPNRQRRARQGKTDFIDADMAAAAVLAGETVGVPKSGNGNVESLRMLRVTRASAVKAKGVAIVELQHLVITAPIEVREALAGLSARKKVRTCAQMTPVHEPKTPEEAAIFTLAFLARRYEFLEQEAKELERQIERMVHTSCPELLELPGVGPDVAATLLTALGDNGGRIRSEAAFAKLCGVSPLDASSGRQVRHRLNRGGNRQANRALHTLIVVRLRIHQPSKDYIERRLAEGKTKKEVMRCLKRYAVREVYRTIRDTSSGDQHLLKVA